jgi:hypothetical protein
MILQLEPSFIDCCGWSGLTVFRCVPGLGALGATTAAIFPLHMGWAPRAQPLLLLPACSMPVVGCMKGASCLQLYIANVPYLKPRRCRCPQAALAAAEEESGLPSRQQLDDFDDAGTTFSPSQAAVPLDTPLH